MTGADERPETVVSLAKKTKKPPKVQDRRKKRTREHVIADQSLAHIQQFIANAGFTSEAVNEDYGYDMTVNTFDGNGFIEGGSILIQLKASETLTPHAVGLHFLFDLDLRDYDLWKEEPNPVFLILYEASTRRAYWLFVQPYLERDPGHRSRGLMPKPSASRCRRSTKSAPRFSGTPAG